MDNKKSLEELRRKTGKSKLEFSKKLGIPYTTYSRYENDLSAAPFSAVVMICEKLGVNISEIKC